MTHSGGKPHKVGDRGQRYEIRSTGYPGEGQHVVGWTSDYDRAEKIAAGMRTAPGCTATEIWDRQENKRAVRPLRATYNPDAPYVVQRHDDEDGSIQYEIMDKRPDSYRRLCTITDEYSVTRGQAKKDAEMIVAALNQMHASVDSALAAIPDKHYWLLAKGRLRPTEPLYAIQLLKPGTEEVIAQAEGDSIQQCVSAALGNGARD